MPSGRSRSSCWRRRRRSSSSLRSSRARGAARRMISSAPARRGSPTTGPSPTTSSASRPRSATARSSAPSRGRSVSSGEASALTGTADSRAPVPGQRDRLRADGRGRVRLPAAERAARLDRGGRDERVLRRGDRMELVPFPLAPRPPELVAVSATRSLDATVESLCGDLAHIRAPRGSELNARSWATEAPLRMLLNNLDPEVAERPEELIVYGGSGKAARNHEALRAIVRSLLELGDDETLLVQSGKPVGLFRTHPGAPRVLIANSLLVPRWATWDEFRRLEAAGLTMFGQMTAGSWIYIGTQGILQGTYQTFAAAAEKHFGSVDLAGRTILTAGLGGMGGAQPLAATMLGAAILCVEVDPARIRRRIETRYLDEAADSLDDGLARVRAAAAEGRALSVGLLGNAADVVPELVRRGE